MCGIFFYSHQLIPKHSEEHILLEKEYLASVKKRTLALNKVKELTKGTELYNSYMIEKKATKLAWKNFKNSKESEKIFGFKSIRYFIERFGLMLCIFCYAVYNLIKSYRNESKNIGALVIHTFIISVTFFYFFWIFQRFQDFSKATYYIMTVASAIFISIAVYLITRYRKDTISQLQKRLFLVAKSALLNTQSNKKEEMHDLLKKIANDTE
ncbi:hypothetical protein OAT18_04145 [Tenacibaculum sp.]|nr:hypothetical protein [Tenacibaculum sp.]